jgi:hypothetical protein
VTLWIELVVERVPMGAPWSHESVEPSTPPPFPSTYKSLCNQCPINAVRKLAALNAFTAAVVVVEMIAVIARTRTSEPIVSHIIQTFPLPQLLLLKVSSPLLDPSNQANGSDCHSHNQTRDDD